jgi:CRP-like cAMP-binding protein
MDTFLKHCQLRSYEKNDYLLMQGQVCNHIYFINQGLCRTLIVDENNNEHTINFALANDYVTDYASFLKGKPAVYSIQALEKTEVVLIPKKTVQSGYENIKDGNKLGRLIAEHYFLMISEKLEKAHIENPLKRYLDLEATFPDIHQRLPQHIIASFLGVTPVHLSRLKSQALKK